MTSFLVAVNIDDCADMDMVNGRCFDMVAAFEIVCDSGFEGQLCQGEIVTHVSHDLDSRDLREGVTWSFQLQLILTSVEAILV